MNGKDYVEGAARLAGRLLEEIQEAGIDLNEDLKARAARAVELLGGMKNKATLRTKHGTNMAFPVMETAQNLEEAVQDRDPDEAAEALDDFISAVETLSAGLKDRTVIMT